MADKENKQRKRESKTNFSTGNRQDFDQNDSSQMPDETPLPLSLLIFIIISLIIGFMRSCSTNPQSSVFDSFNQDSTNVYDDESNW